MNFIKSAIHQHRYVLVLLAVAQIILGMAGISDAMDGHAVSDVIFAPTFVFCLYFCALLILASIFKD